MSTRTASRISESALVTFRALGTVVSVLVTEPGQRDTASAILRAELAAADAACSRFRDDSELSRLNRAGGRAVTISRYVAGALSAALAAAEATDGDVDPTCGRCMIAIGYDRDFDELRRDAHRDQPFG
jgi:FAD:protein FMN transferase